MLSKHIIVQCPRGYHPKLEPLIEAFIREGVEWVAVMGHECSLIEELIDEMVVGDGSEERFLVTTSHPDESVEDVLDLWPKETDVHIIELDGTRH